jgi:hypothetical protein
MSREIPKLIAQQIAVCRLKYNTELTTEYLYKQLLKDTKFKEYVVKLDQIQMPVGFNGTPLQQAQTERDKAMWAFYNAEKKLAIAKFYARWGKREIQQHLRARIRRVHLVLFRRAVEKVITKARILRAERKAEMLGSAKFAYPKQRDISEKGRFRRNADGVAPERDRRTKKAADVTNPAIVV